LGIWGYEDLQVRRRVKQLLNFASIVISYIISRIFRKVVHWGKPVFVSIEPTNICNLHCPECPSGKRELVRARGNMDPELFRYMIDQLTPELTYMTLYFQGEPYLHKDLMDMVRYARSKGIYVSSSTNGHFLTPETARATVLSGLNRLIISLDGTTQDSYEQYRIGGSLEEVISGIRNLTEARNMLKKHNPRIIIQFLVLRSNEHQIGQIKRLRKTLGADKVEIKSAQFNDFKHGNRLMPENKRYNRYRLITHQSELNNQKRNPGFTPGNFFYRRGAEAQRKISFMLEYLNLCISASLRLKNKNNKFRNGPHLQIFKSSNPQISRYSNDLNDSSWIIKNSLPNHCFRMWSSCVITWDGKVVPCCFEKDAIHTMGNLHYQSLREIWKSEAYRQFRQQIFDNRKNIEICQNCTEGMGLSRWL
jgi:radical SAM protein with 4Fe4S-binding SPASM domain